MTSQTPSLNPNPTVVDTNNFTPEQQAILAIINKWNPELRNPSKYGEVLAIGLGYNPEGSHIIVHVKHKNALTNNIPSVLDGVPVKIREGGIMLV
jgi:hypothetical protein